MRSSRDRSVGPDIRWGYGLVRTGPGAVRQHLGAMDLVGMGHRPKPQCCAQSVPATPGPGGRGFAEEGEIPGAVASPMIPAGSPLSQPGVLSLPFGVSPESGDPIPKYLSDRPNLNLRGIGAYHEDELPESRAVDPGNLSFYRKFRSFQSHPNR